MKQAHIASRIPTFTSREQEAAWWDSHDLADYWDEFTPVQVTFAKHLSRAIAIRLDHATFDALRRQAEVKGMPPTTLAHLWILERLAHAEHP